MAISFTLYTYLGMVRFCVFGAIVRTNGTEASRLLTCTTVRCRDLEKEQNQKSVPVPIYVVRYKNVDVDTRFTYKRFTLKKNNNVRL